MKSFDIKRFGLVLKLDFAEGLKAMMWGALCMTLLYLFYFWFAWNVAFHNNMNPGGGFIHPLCEAVGVFSAMTMYIFFLLVASTLWRGEQKKQQRTAWLMLPASNLEKFLSRWVYLLVFSLVGGLLTFFVADLLHMAYLWMTDYPVVSATDDFFNLFPHTRKFPSGEYTGDNPLSVTRMYTFLIALHALFLLGGVFFKKFHFIATSAVVVMGFACMVAVANMAEYRDTPITTDFAIAMNNILWIAVQVGLTVLFTWLAYRLFCRWQVVTPKFANL